MNYLNRGLINKRIVYFILLIIILFGLFLRLDRLAGRSFWFDEIQTICNKAACFRAYRGDYPRIYLMFINLVTAFFGPSEFFCRVPSVIFGLLTIFMVYKLARMWFDKKTALISAFLLTVSTFHIYYSQLVRIYALFILLSVCSVYFLYKGFIYDNKKSLLYIIFFFIVTLLNIAIHYVAFYVLVPEILFLFFFGLYLLFGEKIINKRIFLILLLLVLIVTIFYLKFPEVVNKPLHRFFRIGTVLQIGRLKDALRKTIEVFTTLSFGTIWGKLLIWLYLGGFFIGLYVLGKRYKRELCFMLIFLFLPFLIDALFFKGHFQQRHISAGLPLYLICIAVGFRKILFIFKYKWYMWLLLGLLLMVHIIPLVDYHRSETDDWRTLGGYLRQYVKKGDAILFYPWEAYNPGFLKVCPYIRLNKNIPIYINFRRIKDKGYRNLWYIWVAKGFEEKKGFDNFKKKWMVFREKDFKGNLKLYQLRNIEKFVAGNMETISIESEYETGFTGKVVQDSQARNGKARMTEKEGFLVVGPYAIWLPEGDYRVKFRLKLNKNSFWGKVCEADVFETINNSITGKLYIKGTDFAQPMKYQDFTIKVSHKQKDSRLEFRVFSKGKVKLWVDCIEVAAY